ncbi:kinase-like domain-containing protein [Cristinia sonorae]|uniref:Kinase-like domain-containing protein n=1 Tax=Cristinia sonorae TaxID=1940300 RepID=A0A8K0XM21_9AGAR|nr:kinase-like domain-containing protein [Cristinia sonorae]
MFNYECMKLQILDHSSLLPFLGIPDGVFTEHLCFVIPWMENGNIRQFRDVQLKLATLNEENFTDTVNTWLYQIAEGLAYLHRERIVHGDLHSGNILINQRGHVQLADFGLTMINDAIAYTYQSTHGDREDIRWNAPELIFPARFGLCTSHITTYTDVYAFACVIYEMYAGHRPFAEKSNQEVSLLLVQSVRAPRPTAWPMSDPLWRLTTLCWAQKPNKRPSADDVVKDMCRIRSGLDESHDLSIWRSSRTLLRRITSAVWQPNP